MDQFTVSARKYRPGTFHQVVGQKHITGTLKNAIIKNHLAQAFLFCGPRGVGKTTCARILAKTINCLNITPEGEACNECDSCKAFNKQQSFNIYELDAASNNSVDDIRNLVEQVRYAPQSGKYKTYIIDEVHMLSTSAFNAFLKTLEEPPPYAIFIMATTERHKIIPTILSRCQIFDFQRIKIADITEHLKDICIKEGITAEEEALHVIAQKADGALRDALSIFDRIVSFCGNEITYNATIENLNILDYEYFFRLTDDMLNRNIPSVLITYNEILQKGFDAHNFINGMSEHFRNLLVCKDASTLTLLELPETASAKYRQQATAVGLSYLLSALNILNQADLNFKGSKNQRLHVELSLLKLCHINDAINLATEIKEGAKKKQHSAEVNDSAANYPILDQTANRTPPLPKIERQPPVPLSINEAKNRFNQMKSNGSEMQTQANATATDTPELNPDAAVKSWKSYAELHKKRGSFYSMMTSYEPEVSGNVIKIRLENPLQEQYLIDEKMNISTFLQEDLNHPHIEIHYTVLPPAEEEGKRYLVTNKDKFNRMVEINPDLDLLRVTFDLKL